MSGPFSQDQLSGATVFSSFSVCESDEFKGMNLLSQRGQHSQSLLKTNYLETFSLWHCLVEIIPHIAGGFQSEAPTFFGGHQNVIALLPRTVSDDLENNSRPALH